MSGQTEHIIYTIGHSNHSADEFLAMLQSFEIQLVADIRGLPGSRKYPHFNKEVLEVFLRENGIEYIHIKELGGRRRVKKDSKNTRWQNDSFRGYADYMESSEFEEAAAGLERIALRQRTAFMCAEALWWRCHRSMVSDYLKAKGWTVLHIMGVGKAQEHTYTTPARIVNGRILYSDEE